jgi:DHA2 family multidrug resistance protein
MIIVNGVAQGIGLGLVFVPLSSVSFLTLPIHLRTSGSAILTLIRNVGSSIGISMVIANLTSKTTMMHARLTESVTPFNDALQFPDVSSVLNMGTDAGRAMMDAIITQQAAVIAYANDFKLLMVLTLIAMPFVFFIGKSRAAVNGTGGGQGGGQPAHAALD